MPNRKVLEIGTMRATDSVSEIAGKAWDAGLVEEINGLDAQSYVTKVAVAMSEAMFWCGALVSENGHDDDPDGYSEGKYDLPDHDTSGYDLDSLDASDRESIEKDAENFVRSAWPYLVAEGGTGPQAGHDFYLTRNHHGAGFWDGDWRYGKSLTIIAESYGSLGVQIGVDSDGDAVEFQLHG